MVVYLLKFSACLLLFLAFYKLLLEKENMHLFKRFYLLAASVLSLVIPLLTFTQYVEPTSLTLNALPQDTLTTNNFINPETSANYLPYIIWSIYLIGILLFGFTFIRNLYRINHKIKYNPKRRFNKFTHVLLKDLVAPHTFFSYIFFNKKTLESNNIPEEVFWHEQTHAIQKHSIDVLFIEALQVLFWFNPLIYIIKHAIKLNHEFLADQGVLQKGVNTNTYQNTILAFSSNAAQPLPIAIGITNAINYASIKKRFTVMKTQTTKRGIWLRSFILLPLLAIMLYSFSSTKIVEKNMVSKSSITNHTARSIDIEILNNGTYKIDNFKATKETFISVINQLHQDITPEIRNQIINIHVNGSKYVSDEEVWFIYNSVIDYGFHRIVTYNQEIIREKGNKPVATTNTGKPEHSKDIVEQRKATKAQIKEYNKLAKKYNNMSKDEMHVNKSDLERLKLLFSKMSDSQRKNAEPFPNIPPPPPPIAPKVIEVEEALPPPPPPIPANATKEQKVKYKKIVAEYAKKYPKSVTKYKTKKGKLIDDVEVPTKLLPPPPPIPENATPEQKKQYEKTIKEYKIKVAKTKQNLARVRKVNEAKRAEHKKVKQQLASHKKESQKIKLARVAQIKQRQEKLKQEKKEYLVKRESLSKEHKAQLKKVKLRELNEQKVEIEKRQEQLKKEKLKHIEERKVLAEKKRENARAMKLKRLEENHAKREMKSPTSPPTSAYQYVKSLKNDDISYFYNGKLVSYKKILKITKKEPKINMSTKIKNRKGTIYFTSIKAN